MLYRDSLTAHEWTPPVPPKLHYVMNERQWLLISNNDEKCAFLHVYIACQSFRSDSFLQWNEDLFFLITQEAIKLRRQGFVVLAMGDFNSRVGVIPGLEGNTPDTNRNTPMFMNFVNEVNLVIINTLPISKGLFTRFMDDSGKPGTRSLLDYGLIDNDHSNTVTSFVIDEHSRFDAGSDHAVLECVVSFGACSKVTWSFHEAVQYDIKEDYSGYHSNLDQNISSISLSQFGTKSTEQMLPHISESINQSALKSFGLKIKKKRRGQKLPRPIISKIKNKNDLVRALQQARQTAPPHEIACMQREVDAMKADIKDLISDVKLKRRHHIRTKVLRADPTRKKFWRFLKNQIKSAGTISACNDKTGKMVFEQADIEEAVLEHFAQIFSGQRHPVYPVEAPASQIDLTILELDQILDAAAVSFQPDHFESKVCSPYSFVELGQALEKLPPGKSSGYDSIPNELLRNSTFTFKQYLLIFLNKILEDGVVPQNLNLGKCMLIHKVRVVNLHHSRFNTFIVRVVIPWIRVSIDQLQSPPTCCVSSQ